jgi:hypothetical protein
MSVQPPTTIPKMLVLGGQSSGKSTYRAQLYQRIEHSPGDLRLVKSVGDLTAIEGDVELLVQGLQPRHTTINTYQSTTFAVQDRSGREFRLEFADYDGEQVSRMANVNHLSNSWIERAQQADSWLYFLRIDAVRSAKSFMTDPVTMGPRSEANERNLAVGLSSEISAIETLQRLLFARGAALQKPLQSPRLAVLLSCWDELPAPERDQSPSSLLATRAPLLSWFIKAMWSEESVRVWGLSSTEQPLPESGGNKEFARTGPQHFGYIVVGDRQSTRDLTMPVAWLLQPR